MGIDITTYIGPYLQCRTGKTDVKAKRKTCINVNCKNNNQDIPYAKFCIECGGPISEIEFIKQSNMVDRYDLRNKIKDLLVFPSGNYFCNMSINGVDIWYGNRYRPNKTLRNFNFDTTNAEVLEISTEDLRFEIDEFLKQYQEGIAIIKETYGPQNVEIKWGIVNSMS